MNHYLPKLSLTFFSLGLCQCQSFKLRKLFFLFFSPLVIILHTQHVSAANLKPADLCPSTFLQLKPQSTTSEPKTPVQNDHSKSPSQLSLLSDSLLNQAKQVRFYPFGSGSIVCLPDVSESASAVLRVPQQDPSTSPGLPYIVLAVNLAFLLCILPLLSKPVRNNNLSEDDLSAIRNAVRQCISDTTADQSILQTKVPSISLDNKLTSVLSSIVEVERLLTPQASQINSLVQEISTFRNECLAAINSLLPSTNDPELSMIPSSEVFLEAVYPPFGDTPASPPQDNYRYLSVVNTYRNALKRADRSLLRKICKQQLVISSESEEALLNSFSAPTRLVAVGSGGSYLLVPALDRNDYAWILPDWQTLESFNTKRPNKGIFSYTSEANLCSAELRQPAEVKQVGELWEVVTMGVIAVGG